MGLLFTVMVGVTEIWAMIWIYGASFIIKTNHHYYKHYFRLANIEGVGVRKRGGGECPGVNVLL